MDFDPAHFFTPKKDWKAPYPYCPDDVLFLIEQQDVKDQILQRPARFSNYSRFERSTAKRTTSR